MNFVDSRMEQGLVLGYAMLEIQAWVGHSPQISNVWLCHLHASKVHLQYKDSLDGGKKMTIQWHRLFGNGFFCLI